MPALSTPTPTDAQIKAIQTVLFPSTPSKWGTAWGDESQTALDALIQRQGGGVNTPSPGEDSTSPVTVATPAAPEYGLPWVPDMDFAEKDPAIIQGEVIADYQDSFKALTGIAKTLAPGDPVRLLLLVVCHWLSHQRTLIDFTGKQNLLKYAREEFLDNLAALHGDRALRLAPQTALTTLTFTLNAPLSVDVIIPLGTMCQAPNSVVFKTTAAGIIYATGTTVSVAAKAVVAGSLGNGFAPGQINSIINWNQPFGVTVANDIESAGGSDEESDEQYRYRIWLAIESYSTCGPRDAYEFWALSANPSIVQCVVHSAPEIAGEVWLYPLLSGGVLPTQAILNAVQEACAPATRRPVSDYVTAKVATQVPFTLDMDYYILSDNQRLMTTIVANVEQAASDWILWQRSKISRDINGDELVKRCLQAGAKRVVINTPSPAYQELDFNEIAIHTGEPVITFAGFEDN